MTDQTRGRACFNCGGSGGVQEYKRPPMGEWIQFDVFTGKVTGDSDDEPEVEVETTIETCLSCQGTGRVGCWGCIAFQSNPDGDKGECRRSIPSLNGWPEVHEGEWCLYWSLGATEVGGPVGPETSVSLGSITPEDFQ